MTTFSYLRVSTIDQDTEKNKLEILQFANTKKLGNVEFTEEKITSKVHYKERTLGTLLNEMVKGDVLIVPELSRLARSVSQILEIINLCKQKEITLYSLKEGFNSGDNGITSVITSTVFALVAQIERDLISQRTKEALHAKKAMGAECGSAITAEIKKGKYIYYHCTGWHKNCSMKKKSVNENEIVNQLEKAIKVVSMDEQQANWLKAEIKVIFGKEQEYHYSELGRLNRKIDLLKSRIDKMYLDYLDGLVSREFYSNLIIH